MHIYNGRFDEFVPKTDHTVLIICSDITIVERDVTVIRKNGRKDFGLFYCKKGFVHFKDCTIHENQIYIYPMDVPQEYVVFKDENTVYYFIHFTGSDVASLLSSLNISVSTALDISIDLTDIFDKIKAVAKLDDALSRVKGEYLVLKLLSILSKISPKSSKKNMMHRVIQEMCQSYYLPYDAKRFASIYALSESRFNHLFKEITGISPQKYFNKIRMENAQILLKETELSVSEIAQRCGFSDPLYFGQAFKKMFNMAPTDFREN